MDTILSRRFSQRKMGWLDAHPGSAHRSMRQFGAVVSCVGFGAERTHETPTSAVPQWQGYCGPRYWTQFDHIPAGHTKCIWQHAMVSGGGDGAMQDFQRLATGYFGKDLLHRLRDVLSPALQHPAPFATPEMLQAFLAAEDAGRRAHAWQGGHSPILALQAWHQAYADAMAQRMQRLLQQHKADVHIAARQLLRPEVRQGQLRVSWVHRGPTPSYAYALNRYLCLVVLELARCTGARVQAVANTDITQVQRSTSARTPHSVMIRNQVTQATHTEQVDQLIIRHGVEPEPLLGGPPVPEQLLPYDLPM